MSIGQNFNLGTLWQKQKTKFCIDLWFQFVCLFWHSFLTKFPIVNIVVLTIFLICGMWKYDILFWFGMKVAGALLEKNCEWTLDMLSLRHSTYPRPLPLLVIHYKQRKKVKYKSQILKTSIFQFFTKQVTTDVQCFADLSHMS